MSGHIKDAGIWKAIANLYVKDAGVWKQAVKGFIKDAGLWKEFYGLVVTASSFVGSTTGTSSTPSLHASTIAGDIAIMFCYSSGTTDITTSGGGTWNSMASQALGASATSRVFWKVATGSGDAPTVTAGTSLRTFIAVYRGGTTVTEKSRNTAGTDTAGFVKSVASRKVISTAATGGTSPGLSAPAGFTSHNNATTNSVRGSIASIDPASYAGGIINWSMTNSSFRAVSAFEIT